MSCCFKDEIEKTRWYNARSFVSGLPRINLFTGGYGSGKSEIAVNFALSLREQKKPVIIADLDTVNPYFRSREVREVLEAQGIRVLVPPREMMETDLPMIGPEIKGALMNQIGYLVLDLGGDPVGARVIASLVGGRDPGDYSGFFVLNSRRPFTDTVEGVKRLINRIEEAAGLEITHLVVNSHLIEETSVMVIQEGIALAEKVGNSMNKPIGFIAVERRLIRDLDLKSIGYPVLVLDRLLLKPWEQTEVLGPRLFKI